MDPIIDIRGLAVQQSWLLILDNIQGPNKEEGPRPMTIVTDSPEKAREIRDMALEVDINAFLEESGGEYLIHFQETALQEGDKSVSPKACVVVITGSTLGRGEQELGKALMKSYFYHLKQCRPCPKTLIFLNGGVALTVEDSEVLSDLRILAEKEVEILSSETCLDFYGLRSSLAVGRTAGMKEIIRRMHSGENTLIL